jgi:two-component system phosphate regulon sensor histidine kinase PhoR
MRVDIRWKLTVSFLVMVLMMGGVLYGYLSNTLAKYLPPATMEQAKADLHYGLGVAFSLTIVLSLILSYLLSSVTSRSLRTMATIAAQIGKGDFGRRIPITSRDEVGELARVMNDMAVKIEGQLRGVAAEKNRLDTILRGMGEGLMMSDAAGIITLVNPAFHSLFGISEDVEGKPLIAISRHPALNDAFKIVIATRSERLEELTLPFKQEKTVLTHWVPLLEDGELQGVVTVFHDISDHKRLEKIRRDFVANVSHELRTPVTVIKGYAEALLSGLLEEDPKRAVHFIDIIHTHGERLATLINDLLSLSELESGDLKLELTAIPVASTVRRACSLLDQKAHERKISLHQEGVDAVPPVLADHGRIEQVFINLIDNAIKYTPENGTVTISARTEGESVAIAVTDTGTGIPPKDLPRIFERFYRVDAARSRDQGGTGLGLSIVKHIVQLHGGTVSVESSPGKGSTFTFTLRQA